MDLDKAIYFIKRNGSEVENERLDSIIGLEINKDKIVRELATLQNRDGGFSFSRNSKSTLSESGFILTWLSDLRLLDNEIALKCFAFFKKNQCEDGSWKETHNENDKTEWKDSKSQKSILFQTANVLFWMSKYTTEITCIEKAFSFLEKNYSSENAYMHTKWLYASLLSSRYSWKSINVKNILNEIGLELKKDILSSVYTWMLWCFSIYEISKENEFARKIMKSIIQNDDGGFESEDGESYRVNATLEAIKVQRYYGKLG